MDIDRHGLCHLRQIRPNAIGSDHIPVGKVAPGVQLSGDLLTHDADLSSPIDEHWKFVLLYIFENGLGGPGVTELAVSREIFQAGDCRNVSDSDFIWCGRDPGSNSGLSGNWDCFSLW